MSNNFLSQLNLFNDCFIYVILFISSEDSSRPCMMITSCGSFLPKKFKINYLA